MRRIEVIPEVSDQLRLVGVAHGTGLRIHIDNQLPIENSIRQWVIFLLPVRKMQIRNGKVSLFPVNLGSVLSQQR